ARIMAGEKKIMASYGLKEGGGGLIALRPDGDSPDGDSPDGDSKGSASACLLPQQPEVVAQLKALRDQIVSGELVIPDPMFAQ
ncbi:MAG: hypothetical protein AAGC55_20990, partial [Myxococcota bacterium]